MLPSVYWMHFVATSPKLHVRRHATWFYNKIDRIFPHFKEEEEQEGILIFFSPSQFQVMRVRAKAIGMYLNEVKVTLP